MTTRVIIESPYRGDGKPETIAENLAYAERCCHDACSRGEVPFASHVFFPHFLDEMIPEQRELGIKLGYEFWTWAEKIVCYMDNGFSEGMKAAVLRAFELGIPIEKRYLNLQPQLHHEDNASKQGLKSIEDLMSQYKAKPLPQDYASGKTEVTK